MMKSTRSLWVSAALLTTLSVQAAPVTVVEISNAGAGSAAATQPRALSAQNEMFFMLQQLQDEVRSLRGIIEQQQYRIDQLEAQQRDRYRDMDKRISLLFQQLPEGAALAASPDQPPAATTGPAVTGDATSPMPQNPMPQDPMPQSRESQAQAKPVGSAAGTSVSADENAAYDAAFAKVRSREFAQAETALENFIRQYPASGLQPNAWYWLGEVYLARQNSGESRKAFNHVTEHYAEHTKAADALYKLGVLSGREGDAAGARRLMQRVVEEYPQAPAAELARGYLKP